MKPTVYLETSVISYLTSRTASDLNTAAHQQITAEWWETKRRGFQIFISKLVWREASVKIRRSCAPLVIEAIANVAVRPRVFSLAKAFGDSNT